MEKKLAMKKRTRIQDIIKEISHLNQSSIHPANSDDLENLQKELDRGAFVRSRRKWMEEGERNSKYFFNLEKRSAEANLIRK